MPRSGFYDYAEDMEDRLTAEESITASYGTRITSLEGYVAGAGNLTLLTLDVTGATTLGGDLTINTNKFTVSAVSGDTVIAGGITAGSLFSSGDITVGAGITLASATGNITCGGTLDVTGITTLAEDFKINTNKFTVASSTGNTLIAGTLDVTGLTTVDTMASQTLSAKYPSFGGIALDDTVVTIAYDNESTCTFKMYSTDRFLQLKINFLQMIYLNLVISS